MTILLAIAVALCFFGLSIAAVARQLKAMEVSERRVHRRAVEPTSPFSSRW